MEQEHIPKHVKIIRIRGSQKGGQRGSRTLEGSTKGAGSDDLAPGTRVSLTRSVSWTQNAAFSSQNKTQTNFLLFYLQTEINKRTKEINWFLSFSLNSPKNIHQNVQDSPENRRLTQVSAVLPPPSAVHRHRPAILKPRNLPKFPGLKPFVPSTRIPN